MQNYAITFTLQTKISFSVHPVKHVHEKIKKTGGKFA